MHSTPSSLCPPHPPPHSLPPFSLITQLLSSFWVAEKLTRLRNLLLILPVPVSSVAVCVSTEAHALPSGVVCGNARGQFALGTKLEGGCQEEEKEQTLPEAEANRLDAVRPAAH